MNLLNKYMPKPKREAGKNIQPQEIQIEIPNPADYIKPEPKKPAEKRGIEVIDAGGKKKDTISDGAINVEVITTKDLGGYESGY